MGSGKSSVLEAISFALFGTFPALERRKLKLEDILRLTETKTKVILGFSWNDSDYRVERGLERKKRGTGSSAEIFKDNVSVENGPTAVTSYVETLTGVDYDLFTRAIYSEQNNVDYFLNLDPRRRKQEMDALLGLDKFETARSNAVTVIGRVNSKRQGMEERINKEKIPILEEKEKQHSSTVLKTEEELKITVQSCERQEKETRSLSETFQKMKTQKEQYEKLDKEIIGLTGQQKSLRKELEETVFDKEVYEEKKKNLIFLSENRTNLLASLKSFDLKNIQLSREIGSLEAKIKSGTEANILLSSLKKDLSEALNGQSQAEILKKQQDSENNLLSIESEYKSIERELTELADLITKLKPGLSECPLCSSKLAEDSLSHIKSEKESLIKKKNKRLEELSKLKTTLRKEEEELQNRIKKASLLVEKATSLEKEVIDLVSLKSKKDQLEKELSEANSEKIKIQEKSDVISKELEKLSLEVANYENLLKKRKDSEQLEQKLLELKNQLSSIEFNEKTFEELRHSLENSRISLERTISKKKSLEEQLRMNKDMLKVIQEELSEIKKLSEYIKQYSTLEEQLTIYKNALLETQTTLRATLTDAINSAMNEIWPIFYPYRNYHALRLGVSEKDYVFEVSDGTNWKPLESIASGGERTSAALTLRVALAMVLTPKLSWLILDEPTHNLDSEAIDLLSHALQFKVPEVVTQTFVITHEEGLMGSDFASSYRLTRDKQHNEETKIEIA